MTNSMNSSAATEKMTENQELYARIRYVLFDRPIVHGYSRVLMRKPLA
jgi:hypothetical protein